MGIILPVIVKIFSVDGRLAGVLAAVLTAFLSSSIKLFGLKLSLDALSPFSWYHLFGQEYRLLIAEGTCRDLLALALPNNAGLIGMLVCVARGIHLFTESPGPKTVF